MKKLSFILMFLVSAMVCGAQNLNETFSLGDFLYTIIDNDPPSVSLDGFIDTANAHGSLMIPEMVTYEGSVYSITEVGHHAFYNCRGLTGNLELPSTIKRIGACAFSFCSGFTGILVMPDSLEVIENNAFERCSGFTGLVFNNGLREIGVVAFAGCENLSGTLAFPETVEHICFGAFEDCRGFSGDLVIPNSVVGLGVGWGGDHPFASLFLAEDLCTFENCFDHVQLSQSLDTIGNYCFSNCSKLSGDLVIPNSVRVIGGCAFSNCSGFTNLSLGDSLREIRPGGAFAYCTGITNLTMGDSLKFIGHDTFNGCSGIVGSLVLPENIRVGYRAFKNCEGIEKLILPQHISFLNDNVDNHDLFYGCKGLTEVEIPEGWTTTSNRIFSHCVNLQHVRLPESLEKISKGSFEYCYSLEEIMIPENVTEIEMGVFSKCTSLGELVIPDLVEEIVPYTFDSCVNLKRMVLGDSIKRIEDDAFVNCSLELLELKPLIPPQYNFIYGHECLPDNLFILVPCGTLEAYQSVDSWKRFTNIIADCGGDYLGFLGFEWFYEITNDDGTITYQHLEYVADTTVNDKEVKIIIRNNTLYDKNRKNVYDVITREYLYEENNVVYWWSPTLRQFTVLYDFNANVGDEWEIKVGSEIVVMHVDFVDQYYHDGNLNKMLKVSDSENLFSGTILQGIGHLTSFFPERLMNANKSYRVEGIRCFWQDGNLVFKYGDRDCDEIYKKYHSGLEETLSDGFRIYPNPTDGLLIVETPYYDVSTREFRVTNLMGQTLLTGSLTTENHQINVSSLPDGLYFITIGNVSKKLIIHH